MVKGGRLWDEKCVALMITGLTKGKCLWDDSKKLTFHQKYRIIILTLWTPL